MITPLIPFSDVYDGVVLQVAAEKYASGFRNIRSVALHVSSREVYTIPRTVAYYEYGNFVCASVLMNAKSFAAIALQMDQGCLTLGSTEIAFALNPAREGFQPSHVSGYCFAEPPLITRSSWSRLRTSNDKVIDGITLSESTLPKLVKSLAFLHTKRWQLLDLTEHPEKLAEFDEIWPTPVWEFRHSGNVHIADPYFVLTGRTVELRTQVWVGGLLCDSMVFNGLGPHELPSNAEAAEIDLFVDGVLLDKSTSSIVKRLDFSMGVGSPRSFRMSRSGAREGLTVPISPRSTSEFTIGTKPSLASPVLRDLGQRWRDQRASWKTARVERIYNPGPNTVARAFADIQSLSPQHRAKHIIVVDRYSINQDALEAIAALAASHPAGLMLDILTKFEEPQASDLSGNLSERIARFKSAVAHVSRELDIHIRVFHAMGIDIHDRFLCVDERVWHVGPSFNALGESLSAIVEMTDISVIAELREILGSLLIQPKIEEGARES